MEGISKEEVALYDRQIRLWGMEAQGRLRGSTVCMVGVRTATLEAGKNLVLAGIGKLTLSDPTPVTATDLETQYYFDAGDLGRARDEVLAEKLRVLNPLVDIQAAGQLQRVEGFDVVVVVGGGQPGWGPVQVAEAARAAGVRFMAADAFGLFGYIFADCLDVHEYVEEVRAEGPAAEGAEPVRQIHTASYRPLAKSLAARLEGSSVLRLRRKYPPLALVCQVLVAEGGGEMGADELGALVERSLGARGIPADYVDGELVARVARSWGTELVPCAAVIGGTLAQEVLKAVTRKDRPVSNWYVYDALKGDGITYEL